MSEFYDYDSDYKRLLIDSGEFAVYDSDYTCLLLNDSSPFQSYDSDYTALLITEGKALILSGGGSLIVSWTKAVSGDAVLSGNGSLVVIAAKAVGGDAAISGNGSLVVAGIQEAIEDITISGGGSVIASGEKHGLVDLGISAATHVLASGVKRGLVDLTISAGGSVVVAIEKGGEGTAVVSGNGTLTVTADILIYDYAFGRELIGEFFYIKNIDEVKNHILIEGEEYSLYDEFIRILDGTEILFNLDDVEDGASYGRMALTSISAGKIIIAGLNAEVTDQMFASPASKDNIEAWIHASDVTLIDGGKIYTGSIVANSIAAGAIETDKLDALAVTADKIAANTITVNEINFSPYLIGTHNADNVPASATRKWAAESGADITGDHQANSFLNQGALAILSTIGTTHIDAGAVTTSKVYALAITTGKIAAGAVTTSKVYALAITAGKIAAGAIETDKLDALAVTADKIAANTITASEIQANTITVVELSFGAVNLYGDGGLTIDQGSLDDDILAFKSSDVNHQITSGAGLWGAETDTFAYFRKVSAHLGGLHLNTFTDPAGVIAFQVYAVYGAANTDKNGNASGAINLAGLRADPANHTYQDALHGENIFVIKTKPAGGSFQAIFIIDEDGDILYDGGASGYQDHDDIALLKDVEDILGGKISPWHMKRKEVFTKHKIIHVAEVDKISDTEGKKKTGKKRLDRFISSKKMNMLFMGAIRQLDEKNEILSVKIESLETRLDSNN